MKTLSNIQLAPVIQFFPPDLGDHQYPYQKGPLSVADRYSYWTSVMKIYGLEELEPIAEGYEYVPAGQIKGESLEALIKVHLPEEIKPHTDYTDEWIEDWVHPFQGGVLLFSGDNIVYTPQCCVAFDDYREWLEITRSSRLKRLWIGHPWVYYRFEEEAVIFSGLIQFFTTDWEAFETDTASATSFWKGFLKDLNPEQLRELLSKYRIDAQEFRAAIEHLRLDIREFQQRLTVSLEKMGYHQPKKIAYRLVSGEGYTTSYDPNQPEPALPESVLSVIE